ncbi:repetitive proline-rich cell wall protein-like isoform X5 [Daphnia pulicaria]|uniref:repetitive proline-rich cell wall protein-like isoform X5 n=1 Tax=Daphnia pulicaria TaxID=35523 RepID=UPI001EECE68F|nr:repetitive proline-rich cell wall protein-like isoform X5 [Daphnia pulicaria]
MKFFIFAALFAVAAAGTYKTSDYVQSKYEAPAKPDYEKQPYSFSWDVKDEDTYNDFVHTEESDGKVISGSYRVELPDGRTQIVTYRADENGNVADVTYEGEAQYPDESEYKAAPAYSAPAYKAPAYSAPAYKAPSYSAPAYPAPAYKAPAYSAPAYKAPSYSAPAYSAPAYTAPAYSAPAYKAPVYSAPEYMAPIFRSAYKTPAVYPAAYPKY